MKTQQDHLRIWEDRTVLAVMAGKGGVGKSTVAAAVAKALAAAGKSVCVVDADFYGPSQSVLFPVANPRIRTENGLMLPHRVDGVEVFTVAHLMQETEAITWRGPYLEPLLHLIGTYLATDAEVIILDCPPGTGDVQRAIKHLCPHVRYLFVAKSGKLDLADVRRALGSLRWDMHRVLGIIDNMAYLKLDDTRLPLWGEEKAVEDLAAETPIPFLGCLPMADFDEVCQEVQAKMAEAIIEALAVEPVKPTRESGSTKSGTVRLVMGSTSSVEDLA